MIIHLPFFYYLELGKAEVREYHVEFIGDGTSCWIKELFMFKGSVDELLDEDEFRKKHVSH